MIPIQEIINKAVREPREKKEQTSWHPSALGSCLRGQYFQRLGTPPDKPFDDRTLRVFSVGNIIEEWVVKQLEKDTKVKLETQVRIESKELNVSGYADAVVEYSGDKEVLEIKSKNSKWFGKYPVSRQHQQQLWLYLYLLKIKQGSLYYVSKDDQRIEQFSVELDDEILKGEVFKQLALLNQAWKNKSPNILPLPDQGSWQQKYCRFHSNCVKA